MLRHLIIATIFTVHTLSIASIANAKTPANQGKSCDIQRSNPATDGNISTKDINAICQLVTNHYRTVNGNFLRHQLFLQNYPEKVRPGIRPNGIESFEITGLRLSPSIDDTANLQITLNTAVYDFGSRTRTWVSDESSRFSGTKLEVKLFKRNGKWLRDPNNIHWNRDMKESIKANEEDI
jgi:hypothetical protein